MHHAAAEADVARDGETVAAVVAGAAQDDEPVAERLRDDYNIDVSQLESDDNAEENQERDEIEAEIDDLHEDLDAEIDEDRPEEAHHEDDGHHGSGFAATALKFLIIVLVVFAVAAWLVPRAAPWLPAPLAKHLMPGQQLLDDPAAGRADRETHRDLAATTQ